MQGSMGGRKREITCWTRGGSCRGDDAAVDIAGHHEGRVFVIRLVPGDPHSPLRVESATIRAECSHPARFALPKIVICWTRLAASLIQRSLAHSLRANNLNQGLHALLHAPAGQCRVGARLSQFSQQLLCFCKNVCCSFILRKPRYSIRSKIGLRHAMALRDCSLEARTELPDWHRMTPPEMRL